MITQVLMKALIYKSVNYMVHIYVMCWLLFGTNSTYILKHTSYKNMKIFGKHMGLFLIMNTF